MHKLEGLVNLSVGMDGIGYTSCRDKCDRSILLWEQMRLDKLSAGMFGIHLKYATL